MADVRLNRKGMRIFAQSDAVADIVKERARIIQRVAQRLAPVETGAYRRSISVSLHHHPSRVAAHVSSDVPYAGIIESRNRVLRRALSLVAGR